MRLNLHHLATLRELERLGTLSAVARSLSYTPGALSQQMDALERAVGAPVLVRSGRRVELTDVGRALADSAEEVLAAEERAREAALGAAGRPTATVTLGTWGSSAAGLLLPVLSEAAERHPGLAVRTREIDVNDAAAAVRRRQVDVAFGLDYPDWPMPRDKDIEIVRLRREQFAVAVARSADLAAPARLADLGHLPWILPVRETAMGRAMLVAFRRAGVEPDVTHEVNDTASSLHLVEQGLGVTPVTDLMLRLVPGAQVRRIALLNPVVRDLVLVLPHGRAGRAGVDALVDVVRSVTAEPPATR